MARVDADMAAGFLPVLVLATIARHGPIHGYGILKRIEDAMGAPLGKEGTVYPLLARLERHGLLASSWGAAAQGPRRKDYVVTAAGRRRLADLTARWMDLRDRLDEALEE